MRGNSFSLFSPIGYTRSPNRWDLLTLTGVISTAVFLKLYFSYNTLKSQQKTLEESAKRKAAEVILAIQSTENLPRVQFEKLIKILNSSLKELRAGLDSGEFTSHELVLAYIQQIRDHAFYYNCIIDTDFQTALQEAEIRDEERANGTAKGILHGIPVSIKDNIATKNMVTTFGCASLAFGVQSDDSLVVEMIKKEGGIVLLKGAMCQNGLTIETINHITGRALNPWNVDRTPGGSSGGDAALVSLRCVPAALGSDIGGSIRFPASFCGIYSFKPTAARVSGKGPVPKSSVPGVNAAWGPMARCVDDLEIMMRSMCQPEMYERDPRIPPLPWNESIYNISHKLTIGYVESDLFWPTPACSKRAMKMTIDALRHAGHTVMEFKLPDLEEVMVVYAGMMNSSKAGLKRLKGEKLISVYHQLLKMMLVPHSLRPLYLKYLKMKYGSKSIALLKGALYTSAYSYGQLAIRQGILKTSFLDSWQEARLDCLLTPIPFPAIPHDTSDVFMIGCGYTIVYNLLDLPTGSLPITLVEENEEDYEYSGEQWSDNMKKCMEGAAGLPIGVQVTTLPNRDEQCLGIMKVIEDLLPFGEKPKCLRELLS
jgi:fatty acid amide hydrolase